MRTRRLHWAPLLLAVGFEMGCSVNGPASSDPAPPAADAPATPATPPRSASPTAPASDAAKRPLARSPFEAKPRVPATPSAPPAAPSPATHWAHAFGGTGTSSVTALVADANGNAYVTGHFSGTIDLGCGGHDAGSSADMFVAKLTPAGACLWSAQGGADSWMTGTAVALDADGALYLAGQFRGAAPFGTPTISNAAWTDGFIARFDAAGVRSWVRSVGGAGDDLPNGIAVQNGAVVLAGSFFGTGNFGGPDLVSAGGEDAFVAGYEAATGAYLWQHHLGGGGGDSINAVSVGAGGRIFVAGHFESSIQVGQTRLESAGQRDAFYAALPFDGMGWDARRFGGAGDDSVTAAALDAQGNVVLAGTFQQSMTLGELTAVGSASGFIAKFDANGRPLWAEALGASSTSAALGITIDASGDVIAAGTFTGAPAVGLGIEDSTRPGPTYDAFVVRYSAGGVFAWSRLFTTGSHIAANVVTMAGSDIVVGGAFDGIVAGETALTSPASSSAFLLAISR
jgi:hypothetical protein